MKSYKYRSKCLRCKTYFSSDMKKEICDKCNKKKPKKELMVNNPNGYNRYNENPTPVPIKLNQLEEFMVLSDVVQRETVSKLGNDIYRLTKEIRPLIIRFKKYKDYYEQKHFGWNWEKD